MTGGLLQLVAKGVDDIFIIGSPEITFFKIIYRRHTNFSRDELDLQFQSHLDFGKEAKCVVQRWGDLLHRLFLVINLPPIDAIFKPLTVKQVHEILLDNGIRWIIPSDRPSDDLFYPSDFERILVIIQKRLDKLDKLMKNFDSMLDSLQIDLHYENFMGYTGSEYRERLIDGLFRFDKYGSKYKAINDMIDTSCKHRSLANADTIRANVQRGIYDQITGRGSFDPASYNHENIMFMLKSIEELPECSYKHLDAFKIYDHHHSINAVKHGLLKNPKLLLKIYQSLGSDDAKFMFYRVTGDFMNLSTIPSNEVEFGDRFTNSFSLEESNESKSIPHPFHDLVVDEISAFHDLNRSLFRHERLAGYFNNNHLWDRLDLSEKSLTKKINKRLSKIPNLRKLCLLNYVPIITNQDIPTAINRYLKRIGYDDRSSVVKRFESVRDSIESELNKLLYDENDFVTINKLNVNFRKTGDENLMLTTIIRLHKCISFNGRSLLPTEYVIERYRHLLDETDFGDNHNLKDGVAAVINLFITPLSQLPDNATYMAQDRNINKEVQINFPDKQVLSDSVSSVWNILLTGFVKNFNRLYRDRLLSPAFYCEQIGAEAARYVGDINDIYCRSEDYYRDFNEQSSHNVKRYLENKVKIIDEQLKRFDKHKDLLDVNIDVRSRDRFESFNQIVKSINNDIITDHLVDDIHPRYDHGQPRLTAIDIIKRANLVDDLDLKTLRESEGLISREYNGFTSEFDVYQFMKDLIIKKSSLGCLLGMSETNLIDIHARAMKIIGDRRLKYHEEHQRIMALIGRLEFASARNCNDRAKFAWIKYIGHYIIDYMMIKINDQEIDCQTGEWLQFWHQVSKHSTKERGYDRLIGNVPELFEFNDDPKRGYQLKIPLKFWFCKFVGSAIPLVALNNSEVEITVKLKCFNEVSYHEPFVHFNRKIEASGYIIAEYIYVEADERNRLVSNKLEYLVEQVQSNGNVVINRDLLDCENRIRERLFFENPCKEIFWALQNVNFINGSLKNCERMYYNYTLDPVCERINPAKVMKIEFCGRDREKYKCAEFYDKVVPYSRHYSTPSDGINVYSFALRPELPTPSGSVNLSKLDNVVLDMILKDVTVADMKCNNTVYRMPIYLLSMNILRIFGGQAGLAFYK